MSNALEVLKRIVREEYKNIKDGVNIHPSGFRDYTPEENSDFDEPHSTEKMESVKEELLSENPAASAAAAMVMMQMQNPDTGKRVKAITPLKNKDHKLHNKAKDIFKRLKDKFSKKKELQGTVHNYLPKDYKRESVNEGITPQGYSVFNRGARTLPSDIKDFLKALKKQDDDAVEREILYLKAEFDTWAQMLKNKRYNESINEGSISPTQAGKLFDKLLKKQTKGNLPSTKDIEIVFSLLRKKYGIKGESVNEKKIVNSALRKNITSTFKDLDKKFPKKVPRSQLKKITDYLASKYPIYNPRKHPGLSYLSDMIADEFYNYRQGKKSIKRAISSVINVQRGYPSLESIKEGKLTNKECCDNCKEGKTCCSEMLNPPNYLDNQAPTPVNSPEDENLVSRGKRTKKSGQPKFGTFRNETITINGKKYKPRINQENVMKITKTQLRQIIKEMIVEAKYESNVKSQKQFRKSLDTIVKKIQSRWGGKSKRLSEPSSELFDLFPIYRQTKQKFGLDRFLNTKIVFTDKSKSPVKWVIVGGFRVEPDDPREILHAFNSFDITYSDGWSNTRSGMDYQIKDDKTLNAFFKGVEKIK